MRAKPLLRSILTPTFLRFVLIADPELKRPKHMAKARDVPPLPAN